MTTAMKEHCAALDRHTPLLTVTDPRGSVVRSVTWHRSQAGDVPEARVNRSAFDSAGRLICSWDPRLWIRQAHANVTSIHSLSGQVLLSDSVDAGWRLSLLGEEGAPRQTWDGRGTVRRYEHDVLLRPSAAFEDEQCVERLAYGGPELAVSNRCGQVIRHDDLAGTRINTEYGLAGSVIRQTQHFLSDLARPDWPVSEAERDALLEVGFGATTSWRYNPLAEVVAQTDSQGNILRSAHTISGQLDSTHVQLMDQPEQTLVSNIQYDAQGRIESETAGNGVITTARYSAEEGRLIGLTATRNGGPPLQALTYDYDPVGNVTCIADRAQPTRHFANQRIEPVSTYHYDTLYQLIEASGREAAGGNQGPDLPGFQSPPDPSQWANYTQTYAYDAGGNLLKLTHVGAQNHSRTFVIASNSNRSLAVIDDQVPDEDDIAAAFDGNGNLLELLAGQTLDWDVRNQLHQVRPVMRASGIDDSERYIYTADGQRGRKVRTTQAKAVTHQAEVRYLPGLEIRTDSATGETLHVITTQAGRSGVRVLHWQVGKPTGISNNQVRYGLTDHLGSSTLELDSEAHIISQESYYPFGGTSCWAGRDAIEAQYKIVRYSGKERDATGLYYYGFRYYAPWLQRWINPDPAGSVDGLNLFRFVRNSPLRYYDREGTAPFDVLGEQEVSLSDAYGVKTQARGYAEFNAQQKATFKSGVDLAASLLRRTLNELSKDSPGKGVPEALKATFGGIDHEQEMEVISAMKISLSRQMDFIKSLTRTAGFKVSLISAQADVQGITYKTSAYEPERTIAISERVLSNHPLELSRVLIHEASHATESTVDVFYNFSYPLLIGSGLQEVRGWSRGMRQALAAISTQGLDTTAVNTDHLANLVSEATGRSIAPEMQRTEFLSNDRTRSFVLLRNADTYSSFVHSTRLPARVFEKAHRKASHKSRLDNTQ